jgi:hypothetical protein
VKRTDATAGILAVVGSPTSWRGGEFTLDPYVTGHWSNSRYCHETCLLDAPLRSIGWLEA